MTEDTGGTSSNPTESSGTTEHARYSWTETETPSIGVVEAVAAATERDATDLPRLADAVDPDALNELLGGTEAGDNDVRVSFEYADTTVTVRSAGTVAVATD